MIADRNYCYVCLVKVTYDEEKIKSLKKICNYVLTWIRVVKTFGYITIEKLLKQDQAILNGNIFTLAFITTFMNFVGMINNLF